MSGNLFHHLAFLAKGYKEDFVPLNTGFTTMAKRSGTFQDAGNYPYDPYRVFVQAMILGALKDVLEIGTYIAKGERARERNLSLAWLKSEECSEFLAYIGLTLEDIERILSEPPERVKRLLAPGKNHRVHAGYDVQGRQVSPKAAESRQ